MADSPIQSSFIPKDATTIAAPVRRGAPGLYELLVLIAIVLFVASSVLAVGVFLYAQFLQTENAAKLDQLQKAKAEFDPALIQQLTRLDDRMQAADQILSTHIAPTVFFTVLSQVTLTTVSYQSLNLDVSNPQLAKVSLGGVAQSVNSIALQADLLSKSSLITSPIFSGIGKSPDGVHFNLAANINTAGMMYSQLIEGSTQSSVPTTVPTDPAQTSPFTRGASSSTQISPSASPTH